MSCVWRAPEARRGVVRGDAADRGTAYCLGYPAAGLPYEAVENGAALVEINPNETPLTPYADYSLRGRAGEVLAVLLREAFEPRIG